MRSEEIKLNEEQKKVIEHDRGFLRVIACPGSGKTEVVSRRIARLIRKGANPEGIVAITFTEKAAEELKTRIREILDRDAPDRADFGDMFVGTIHSFALYILRELNPKYRSFDMLDDAKRVAFVSKGNNFYSNIGLKGIREDYHLSYYGTVLRFIESTDLMLTENVNPDALSYQRFAKHFRMYLDLLEKEKYFDFQTVLHTLVKEIENEPDRLELVSEKLKHITIDEYQDVDPLQEKLLNLMSGVADSVCVVGDDDQGIYHWRGTDVSIIRDFDSRYSDIGTVTDRKLEVDFRSTSGIVKLARGFIGRNEGRLVKNMVHNSNLLRVYNKSDIQYNFFKDEKDELGYIVSRIRELDGIDFIDKRNRKCSLSLGDMAILVRTNEDASKMLDILDEAGIDSIAYSGQSIFDRSEVLFALECIAFLFEQKIRFTDFSTGNNVSRVPSISDLVERYKRVFSLERFPVADPARFSDKIKRLDEKVKSILEKGNRKDYLGGLGFQEIYHEILSAMGAEIFDFGDVINYNLSTLSRAVSDYESVWQRLKASQIKWFFNFIWAYGKSHYSDTQHQDPSMINAVRVMTIHKAKGLEFSAVFIPRFVKRRKRPMSSTFVDSNLFCVKRYEGDEEDERRLYFTALTRSEKYLFITGSESLDDKNGIIKTHPFADELDSEFLSGPSSISVKKSGYPSKLKISGSFGTSYSDLNTYKRCPTDYLFRRIYGYNAGVPPGFGYGTNIHNILNLIHRNYIRNEKVPSEEEIDGIFNELFKLRYAPGDMKIGMEKAAREVVKNYVSEHSRDFDRILETEKRFEFVLDKALISGQIDLMKRVDDDGNISEIEIIDFKTEKENGIYRADYTRQLRYYAIACLDSLGVRPVKALVHHLDESRRTDDGEVDISEPYLRSTREEIKEAVDSILERKFNAMPSDNKCEECDYRLICSRKGFLVNS